MSNAPAESFVQSEKAMHEEARQLTGRDDFGDPTYRTALGVLLESIDRDADLSPTGQMIFRGQIVNTLATRLRSQHQLSELPEHSDHEPDPNHGIRRPIIITGLVRTGSTALHYLMGQDPDLQHLEYWLAAHPQPRPPRVEWEKHPDFQSSATELSFLYDNAPSLMAVHEMRADWPEECRHLLEQSFVDDRFEVAATLPTYAEWYHNTEHLEAYRRHRRLVQLIGSTDPDRRWLLKYPVHLRQLPALLTVYPDACIVQTHRDPCAVIASYTSFITRIRALHENRVDTAALARELERELGRRGRGRHGRTSGPRRRDQFFDLHFEDFIADPIGSVQRIDDHFDHELTAEGDGGSGRGEQDHPQGEHGRHEYDADRSGSPRRRSGTGSPPTSSTSACEGTMTEFRRRPRSERGAPPARARRPPSCRRARLTPTMSLDSAHGHPQRQRLADHRLSGNEYIDYLLGSGPMLLGPRPPCRREQRCETRSSEGSSFLLPNEPSILLAEEIVRGRAVRRNGSPSAAPAPTPPSSPCASPARTGAARRSSSSKAATTARATRCHEQPVDPEPAPFPSRCPNSEGIPDSCTGDVLVAPFNDLGRPP